jgi:hypothetical protein
MGIRINQEPHSECTVGTTVPALAAFPPAVAYTLAASLFTTSFVILPLRV